jgi:hypothetical protein
MSGLLGTFADQRVDWKPGSHDLVWDRTITAVDSTAGSIELDAPLTFLMEKSTGGGTVAIVQSNAPLQNVGIDAKSLDAMGPYDALNYVVESPQPLYEAELNARGLHLPASSAPTKPANEQAPDSIM